MQELIGGIADYMAFPLGVDICKGGGGGQGRRGRGRQGGGKGVKKGQGNRKGIR